MKFYVTKWCLTNGIEEWECEEPKNGMIQEHPNKGMWSKYAHVEGRDWHRTIEGAVNKANAMRTKKLDSLRQQSERLKAMTFTPTRKDEL